MDNIVFYYQHLIIIFTMIFGDSFIGPFNLLDDKNLHIQLIS
jgi:hypothetical protein